MLFVKTENFFTIKKMTKSEENVFALYNWSVVLVL